MQHRHVLAVLATALLAFLWWPAIAPAAGPAGVTVRVEGGTQTLIARTPVGTDGTPVVKDGNPSHSCPGTSVAGALEKATAGQWTGPWFDGLGYNVKTILGETHDFSNDDFWTLWVNNRFSPDKGACSFELQNGDEVLFFPQFCAFDGTDCSNPIKPLGLVNVPARVERGASFTVTVVRFATDGGAAPIAGATVAGGGASAVSGSDGRATLALPASGSTTLRAEKPGFVRSPTEPVCASAGNDGACANVPGLPGGAGSGRGADGGPYRRPEARIEGIRDGQRFKRGRGPRLLRGRVDVGSDGLRAVKLRVLRADGGRCQYFSGGADRLRSIRCGRGWFFKVGDREDWSYLLPRRLPRGRYEMEVAAVDRAHVPDVEKVKFAVR